MERIPTSEDTKLAKSFVRNRNWQVRVENAMDTCEASITGNACYMALQGMAIATGVLDRIAANKFAAHLQQDTERRLSYEELEQQAVEILTS